MLEHEPTPLYVSTPSTIGHRDHLSGALRLLQLAARLPWLTNLQLRSPLDALWLVNFVLPALLSTQGIASVRVPALTTRERVQVENALG